MIIWVKEAADENVDQRAIIESIYSTFIVARLCETGKLIIVRLYNIIGVELNEKLTIKFKYKGYTAIS